MSALEDFAAARGLVVAFICNHCPFVKHMRNEFARFARDYQAKGIAVVAICSNDTDAYPQDGPEGMAEEARSTGYTFPYLFDATQSVAKAYDAACTPDLYLFDAQRKLVYRGQFDDSRPGRGTPTGSDLRAACDALLERRSHADEAKAEPRVQHQVERLILVPSAAWQLDISFRPAAASDSGSRAVSTCASSTSKADRPAT